MARKEKIKVGVIERNHVLRERLSEIIGAYKDMVVVFEASTPDDASVASVDVILLQWEFSSSPLQIQQANAFNNPKLLVINADPEHQDFARCIQCGARGFVVSSSTESDIMDAIRTVAEGNWFIPSQVLETICSDIARGKIYFESGFLKNIELTNRERQITQLISKNLSNKEIAEKLSIGVGTVKTHVHQILKKLGLQRRALVSNHLNQDFPLRLDDIA